MKPFKFNLQKVMDYRLTIEKLSKTSYKKAKDQLDIEVDSLKELKSIHLKKLSYFSKVKNKNSCISELRKWDQYITDNYKNIELQADVVEKSKNNLLKEQQKLFNSIKEKEIIEKLYSKRYQSYKKNTIKHNQKKIDEYTSIIYCNTKES